MLVLHDEMPATETFVRAAPVAAAILWNIRMELETQPKGVSAETAMKEAAIGEGV